MESSSLISYSTIDIHESTGKRPMQRMLLSATAVACICLGTASLLSGITCAGLDLCPLRSTATAQQLFLQAPASATYVNSRTGMTFVHRKSSALRAFKWATPARDQAAKVAITGLLSAAAIANPAVASQEDDRIGELMKAWNDEYGVQYGSWDMSGYRFKDSKTAPATPKSEAPDIKVLRREAVKAVDPIDQVMAEWNKEYGNQFGTWDMSGYRPATKAAAAQEAAAKEAAAKEATAKEAAAREAAAKAAAAKEAAAKEAASKEAAAAKEAAAKEAAAEEAAAKQAATQAAGDDVAAKEAATKAAAAAQEAAAAKAAAAKEAAAAQEAAARAQEAAAKQAEQKAAEKTAEAPVVAANPAAPETTAEEGGSGSLPLILGGVALIAIGIFGSMGGGGEATETKETPAEAPKAPETPATPPADAPTGTPTDKESK